MSRLDNMPKWWENCNGEHNYVKDPTSNIGLSAREKMAQANNDAYRANNGAYRDCPYGSYGTYSTGR